MADMEKNNEKQPSRGGGKNGSNNVWKIACAACIAVAMIALVVFGVQKSSQAKREAELAALASQNTIPVESTTESTEQKETASGESTEPASTEPEKKDVKEVLEEKGVTVPEKEVDFATLQEKTNKDIYAWIYIPDSMIDYPVLQHPTNNTYYLEYNLDGSKGYPGCIYTENYNKKDFSDRVTVMYGHNMKSGAMFAGLHKYEDSQYFEEHPYVYVYTPDGMLVYQIFAACEYSDKHIMLNYNFEVPSAVDRFLAEVTSAKSMNSNYNEDIEVTGDSHILVMSTCIAKKPNNRYIVLGVLLNED